MNFAESIKTCFKKYATFSGRASRSEFWWWMLLILLASSLTRFINELSFGLHEPPIHTALDDFCALITFLPSLAVAVRRLHDVNRSGWWLLIAFTIMGMLFPLLFWNCKKGTIGDNRFGKDPLAENGIKAE